MNSCYSNPNTPIVIIVFKDASIAVTGSLYKLHPKLKDLLERYTRKYSGGWRSKTFLSDDGSGKGAGLVAAIAERIGKM